LVTGRPKREKTINVKRPAFLSFIFSSIFCSSFCNAFFLTSFTNELTKTLFHTNLSTIPSVSVYFSVLFKITNCFTFQALVWIISFKAGFESGIAGLRNLKTLIVCIVKESKPVEELVEATKFQAATRNIVGTLGIAQNFFDR